MLVEEAVHAHLAADLDVAAVVADRIHPMRMPQPPTLPAIVYQKIAGPRDYTHDGPSGLVDARVQFSCWDETYAGAKTLADKVRRAVSGFSGLMGGGVNVDSAFIENEIDDEDDEDSALYRTILDSVISHHEEA